VSLYCSNINMVLLDQTSIAALPIDDHIAGRLGAENDEAKEFVGQPGDQHYRLLAYLSTLFNGVDIIDIGTHVGSSALALSYNPTNTVHTFDIEARMTAERKARKWGGRNIQFHMENLWDEAVRVAWRDRVLACPLILMDIDPHEGPMEMEFYRWLKEIGYKGLLVCDDIWYFKGMRDRFWYHIPAAEKVDVTALGHWSGTGIVHFGAQEVEVSLSVPSRDAPSTADNNYTVVTAYFNLTKRPDASDAIRARPIGYYLANANMTMALEQNLVVFCDAESAGALAALRPAHLRARTRYIVCEFGEFELVKQWYDRITADRKARGYSADPRNTVSYYLFCMLRYVMLQRVIKENPFGSTHFAWCNICIERMGWRSGAAFPSIWSEFRDKFSTCYIDYQSREWATKLAEYYTHGRCSMCSGFFTGSAKYMGEFCERVLAKFAEMATLGLGHADEQLFSLVFFEAPDIFDFYLGDYTEMIVNYGWVRERASEPVRNVLRRLYESGENWPLLVTLTRRWLDSAVFGAFKADPAQLAQVQAWHDAAVQRA
jgi:predicted O-methyltransferase YrrM